MTNHFGGEHLHAFDCTALLMTTELATINRNYTQKLTDHKTIKMALVKITSEAQQYKITI